MGRNDALARNARATCGTVAIGVGLLARRRLRKLADRAGTAARLGSSHARPHLPAGSAAPLVANILAVFIPKTGS